MHNSEQKGLTLIELIAVIILLSVMAVGISGVIGIGSQSFVNVSERDQIIASARFAVERLNREVREALPNSARVINEGAITCLEFVPVIATTNYVNITLGGVSDTIDVIEFIDLNDNNYSCNNCGDSVVIYPLSANDIYVSPNQTRGQLFAINNVNNVPDDVWTITLNNDVEILRSSPTDKLFVVNQPIRYCADNGNLNRVSGYGLANNLANVAYPNGSNSVLMAENVQAQFTVTPVALTRNGVVQLTLTFSRPNDTSEQVVFDHEVNITNTP